MSRGNFERSGKLLKNETQRDPTPEKLIVTGCFLQTESSLSGLPTCSSEFLRKPDFALIPSLEQV